MGRNKGNKITGFVDDYTAFDLETTGKNSRRAEIVEIGAVKVRNGEIVETFSTLVKPSNHIPDSATDFHGISDEMVADAPSIDEVLDDFLDFIGDDVLLGHNIDTYDLNILFDIVSRIKGFELRNDYVDTLNVARNCVCGVRDYALHTLCEHFSVVNAKEHRALEDTRATCDCYEHMRATSHLDMEIRESHPYSVRHGNKKRFNDESKALKQLTAIAKDMISDGIVTIDELLILYDWVAEHEELEGRYPYDDIREKIVEIIGDGIVEDCELEELYALLKEVASPVESAQHDKIDSLVGCRCVVTGEFENNMSQDDVKDYICKRGGIIEKNVTMKTNYVIVGSLGSGDWVQENYGRKVRKAKEYNEKYADKGVNISIIPEADFFKETEACNE